MSKSKRNVVDPDDIIGGYGADTARWFMLSDSPPDRDVIWTEAGVEGAHRFVQRIWRSVNLFVDLERDPTAIMHDDSIDQQHAIRSAAHRRLKRVGECIGSLSFNVAVAQIYELTNFLSTLLEPAKLKHTASKAALREAFELLTIMIAPMMPHLAEECWAALGNPGFVADHPWPDFDPALVIDSEITLPVQVNGKKRGDLTIARDADQGAVERAALALDFVQKALDGKAPRKIIVVPQRIVNVVA